jgi:hypothetical protein
MWDNSKSERFQQLRSKQRHGSLEEAEQSELTQMIVELETEEERLLQPAIERINSDNLRIEAQNQALKDLVQREERLVARLENFLADIQAEKQAISRELTHILNAGAPQ